MVIWFISLFSIGIWRIRLRPSILKAFNPYQAIIYLIKEKKQGFYHIGKKEIFFIYFENYLNLLIRWSLFICNWM
jgi:K+ transporter